MPQAIKISLIVLSVALNVAFIAAWSFQCVKARLSCGHHEESAKAICPLHVQLAATDAQRVEFEAQLKDFRSVSQPICAKVQCYRAELINLIAAPEADSDAIRAKQEAISKGQREMQDRVVEHLLKMKSLLNGEQREKFFDMIRQRSACDGHSPIMMGLDSSTSPER